jgi:TrmH family RNA methyltransferase
MKRVISRRNSDVRRYRETLRAKERDLVLLDGAHLVSTAIRSGISLRHAAVASDALDVPEIRELCLELENRLVPMIAVSASVMAAMSPVRSASAIVALARRPQVTRDDVFQGHSPLVVIACDVQDPGNIGALVRVAEAAGATGAIVSGTSADPFGWKALRASMGSGLRLPVSVCSTAATAVADARRHGCRIVATVPAGGRSLFDSDLSGAPAILVGGEGAGLPPVLVSDADERVTIPMAPSVESLNTAMSGAIVLYEVLRRRTGP